MIAVDDKIIFCICTLGYLKMECYFNTSKMLYLSNSLINTNIQVIMWFLIITSAETITGTRKYDKMTTFLLKKKKHFNVFSRYFCISMSNFIHRWNLFYTRECLICRWTLQRKVVFFFKLSSTYCFCERNVSIHRFIYLFTYFK